MAICKGHMLGGGGGGGGGEVANIFPNSETWLEQYLMSSSIAICKGHMLGGGGGGGGQDAN